jgi:hypothetical protein
MICPPVNMSGFSRLDCDLIRGGDLRRTIHMYCRAPPHLSAPTYNSHTPLLFYFLLIYSQYCKLLNAQHFWMCLDLQLHKCQSVFVYCHGHSYKRFHRGTINSPSLRFSLKFELRWVIVFVINNIEGLVISFSTVYIAL